MGKRTGDDIPEIGIGMLGYAFMGKAHSNAFKQMPYMFWPPPAYPRLVSIAGRNTDAVKEAAARYGFESYTNDWHDIVEDDRIQIFDNNGPNITHHQPCVEAAKAGKDIICEKPLARNAREAKEMLYAAQKAGVKHCCAFNCRLVPAVQLARNIMEKKRLGRIYHFRAQYFQEWLMDPGVPALWRTSRELSGSGALGDFSHIVDLARFLCGEPGSVQSILTRFIEERPSLSDPTKRVKVDVDDAFVTTVEFENGAIGVLEGSRYCAGRKNYLYFEINGENGSIFYDHEHLNYLNVYYRDDEQRETRGFRTISCTEEYHPYGGVWWPEGHLLGWENTFVHEMYHMVDASINGTPLEPYVATFEDGYRAAVVCDAIQKSSETGKREFVQYG